jgi:hypothetical protein
MSSNWIKKAIRHPGALTAQAEAVGKSLDEFCSSPNLTAKTQKRCSLRKTLKKFN